jgi:RNA polymerase sigma factor (sigma-70 family)
MPAIPSATRTSRRHRSVGRECGLPGALSPEEAAQYDRIPEEIEYVPHPMFEAPNAEVVLFAEGTEVDVPEWVYLPRPPAEAPPRLAGRTVLSPGDETTLFLRYNYARYRLSRLIKTQRRRPTEVRAREMIRWFDRALKVRADLVRANLGLVLTMAKRMQMANVEFAELVSEGNLALLRSVERFDVSRGYKFSTYACRAIVKSFHRLATKMGRYRRHFPTGFDPNLEQSDNDIRRHETQREDYLEALSEVLGQNHADLTDIERTIVRERFAICSRAKGRSLAAIGRMIGLSNERVRQIQKAALGKIRLALDARV